MHWDFSFVDVVNSIQTRRGMGRLGWGEFGELALENFSVPIATWTRAQFLTA